MQYSVCDTMYDTHQIQGSKYKINRSIMDQRPVQLMKYPVLNAHTHILNPCVMELSCFSTIAVIQTVMLGLKTKLSVFPLKQLLF